MVTEEGNDEFIELGNLDTSRGNDSYGTGRCEMLKLKSFPTITNQLMKTRY